MHSACNVLTELGPGLVSAKEGTNLIQARRTIELLTPLSKLDPKSIAVIKEGESFEAALISNTGFFKSGRLITQIKADAEGIIPEQYQPSSMCRALAVFY